MTEITNYDKCDLCNSTINTVIVFRVTFTTNTNLSCYYLLIDHISNNSHHFRQHVIYQSVQLLQLARYHRSRKLCSITSKSDFCIWVRVCRLSNPQDDVMSLLISVQPERWRCSPSRRRTLLPTISSSTKSVNPASPFDDV